MSAWRKPVFICSPWSGDWRKHTAYARRCMKDSLGRGEAPLAMHLLYPQVLNDLIPSHREMAINSGCAWLAGAKILAVYLDLGMSPGMKEEVDLARDLGVGIEERFLDQPAEGERMAQSVLNVEDLPLLDEGKEPGGDHDPHRTT